MRLATLAALLAALAAAAAASAVAKDQASAFSCKGGVSARVGGKAVCLKPGAVCKTRFQATYRAHKLICVAGHLRRMAVPKPKPPPPPPPPPPLAPGSARTAPAPLGTPLTVAREFSSDKTWQVKVVAVNTNAWPVVQAAN